MSQKTSKEQNPSWEADSFSASISIHRILAYINCVRKSSLLDLTLGYMNTTRTLRPTLILSSYIGTGSSTDDAVGRWLKFCICFPPRILPVSPPLIRKREHISRSAHTNATYLINFSDQAEENLMRHFITCIQCQISESTIQGWLQQGMKHKIGREVHTKIWSQNQMERKH